MYTEPPSPEAFDRLLRATIPSGGRFGHREHVALTWLAVRGYGRAGACRLVADGIRRTARYAGAPQKFNATVSRAWVEAVAFHLGELPDATFEQFLAANPALLDKRLLTRFYRPRTLASDAARTGWVPPDLRPFPWA